MKENLGTSQEQDERKESTMSSGKSGLMISHSLTKELLTKVRVVNVATLALESTTEF